MNKEQLKKLSREEKEKLYIKLLKEVEEIREDSIDYDFDYNKFTNGLKIEQIENSIIDFQKEINSQKYYAFLRIIIIIIKYLFYFFVLLGIIGLLLFGIRQLF